MSGPALRVPAEEHEIAGEVDLLVAGGGSAGCAAAITGARLGLRTALVEEMPFLGGMSTGGAVGTFCGFYTGERDGSLSPLVGGLPLEIADTLKARGHAYGPIPFKTAAVLPYVPFGVKLLLEELVRREPNLRLLLHGKLTHTVAHEGRVEGVLVHTRAGRVALRARVFVDATGDAELARQAGARTLRGAEIQYPSMMFTMQNVRLDVALPRLGGLAALIEEGFAKEGLPRRGGNLIPTGRPGEVLVALSRVSFDGRPVDGSDGDELTYGELEGRVQAVRLADFLRRRMPGFGEAFVSDTAMRLGIRETRTVDGEYRLSEEDVLGARKFEDGIGRAAWPVERHRAGGETEWKFLEAGAWYTLPFRAFVARGFSNLLVAGRCLSAEGGGFASARVIGPCMLGGQAVAVAARLLARKDHAAQDLDVEALRAELSGLGVPL
jgi:hypothetical protein